MAPGTAAAAQTTRRSAISSSQSALKSEAAAVSLTRCHQERQHPERRGRPGQRHDEEIRRDADERRAD